MALVLLKAETTHVTVPEGKSVNWNGVVR